MNLPTPMTLGQIASFLGGRVEGPADLIVSGLATSPLLAKETEIALVIDGKLLKNLEQCRAAALIVPEGTKAAQPLILVTRPNLAIQKILSAFQPKRYFPERGIHASAIIDPSCVLGEDVAVGANVVIGPKSKIGARTTIMAGTIIGGEVEVGDDCLFHPGCLIADYVQVGHRVILQQGVSLGSDGFGYVTERPSNMERRMAGSDELSLEPNPLLKIPQIGTVIIEDDVEIGANSTIDRATMGATVIGSGAKIDNLVMIAHNCKIGREAILVAQVGIAGSCTVGDRAILAGQVGVKDHINIGRDAILEGKAGVMRDVDNEAVLIGSPAIPARDFMTDVALSRKLPKLFDDFKALQKQVAKLEQSLKVEAVGERDGNGTIN